MSFTYTLRALRQSFRSDRPTAPSKRKSHRLELEGLEERLAPVVGALTIPAPVAPGDGYDGVVQLSMPPSGGSCTGSLLSSGRHILTAAHCVTMNGPPIGVNFHLPGKHITIVVPNTNFWVHPGWNGNVSNGNDVALLRLPVLAPSGNVGVGAERYLLHETANEVELPFRVVGYGRTGTGTTGNANPGGVKRSGQNTWTAASSMLRNEVQAVSRTGSPTGGTFRLTFSGQTTANIAYNATAAQVQAALAALANLGAGDVNVEGGPAMNAPWFVSFRGAQVNTNVPQMTAIDNIIGGSISIATRFQGATEAPFFGALAYDFDNGNARNDALGLFYGVPGLGLGANEASQSQGDSGGPAFLSNRISGIVSYSLPLNPGTPPDIDGVANNSFGELGLMTRVSSFVNTINAQTNLAYQLVLDMNSQHAGNNGSEDRIEVARVGSSLVLRVNGTPIHTDALTDITSVVLRGSNDRDVITVGDGLGDLVTVQGGAGNDELIVSGTAGNDLATLLSGRVILGGNTVYYSAVELVRLYMEGGNDTVNILSTAAGTAVIVDGGADNDTVTIGSLDNRLTTILENVTVVGGTDTTQDVVNINDQGNAAARTFTLTNSSVSWTGGPRISYDTVERLTLNAGTGSDVVNILSTAAATPVTVNAGAGNDSVTIGSGANTLAAILGDVTVNGGPDTTQDVLSINDQGNAAFGTFVLLSGIVSWAGGPTISYDTVERLTLNAGTGNDFVFIRSTAAATPVTVNTGAGNDAVTIGSATNTLNLIGGNVTVNGGPDTTQDVLYLNDQDYTGVRIFILTYSYIGLAGGAAISYGTVERLTLNAGVGDDVVNIVSTAAATPVSINTGAGNDGITLSNPDNSMDDILGAVTVNAGAGLDVITLKDQGTMAARSYGLNSGLFGSGAVELNHSNVEALTLNATAFDDVVSVGGNTSGMTVTLNGGGGADTLTGANAVNLFVLTGLNAGVLDGVNTFSSFENMLGSIGTDTFRFANDQAVLSGWIIGGGGVDTLDYAAFTAGVFVNMTMYAATGVGAFIYQVENAIGGAGNDILVGDQFSNVLDGGAGRDLLIAGGIDWITYEYTLAPDTLLGRGGEDILIAGYTYYDWDPGILAAILAEWVQPTDYWTRVINLYYGIGVPALSEWTAFYNYAVGGNTLLGGEELDLFFGYPGLDASDWDSLTEAFFQVY